MVKTTQLTAPPAVSSRRLSFGPLGWGAEDARKWTHSADGRLASGAPAFFLSAEAWSPGEKRPPDAFFALANQKHLASRAKSPPGEGFDNVCLLALAADLGPAALRRAEDARADIADLLGAPLSARARRGWRKPGLRPSAIDDLAITGLFKTGPRHGYPPELSMLEGDWRPC